GTRSSAALQAILQQVERLDRLLRDLLEMTQAHEPKPSDVELDAFLSRTVEAHREIAAARGVAITAGTVPPCQPLPRFDPFQVQRALDNLLLNAIQNTPVDGSVTVEAHRRDRKLLLRVGDTGPGVADNLRERLFEPFVTGRADGTGLGLA